jgi:hypothetical protein
MRYLGDSWEFRVWTLTRMFTSATLGCTSQFASRLGGATAVKIDALGLSGRPVRADTLTSLPHSASRTPRSYQTSNQMFMKRRSNALGIAVAAGFVAAETIAVVLLMELAPRECFESLYLLGVLVIR